MEAYCQLTNTLVGHNDYVKPLNANIIIIFRIERVKNKVHTVGLSNFQLIYLVKSDTLDSRHPPPPSPLLKIPLSHS